MGIAEKSKSKSTKKKLRSRESSLTELSDSAVSENAKDDCGTESGNILQKFSEKKSPANQRTKVTRTQTRKEKPAETKQERYHKREAENDITLQTESSKFSPESKTEGSVTSQPLSTSQEYDSIPSCRVENLSRNEQSNKRPKLSKSPIRKRSVKTDNKKASGRSSGGRTAKIISGQSRRKYTKRNNTSRQESNENEVNTVSAEQPTRKKTDTENLSLQRSRSPINTAATDTDIRSKPESLEKDPGKPKSNLSSAKRKRESNNKTSAGRNMEQTSQEYSEVNDVSTDSTTTSDNSKSLAYTNAEAPKRSRPDKSPEADPLESKNTGESVVTSEGPCKEIRSKSRTKNSPKPRSVPLSTKQPQKPVKGRSKSEKIKKRPVSITRRKTTAAKKATKTRTTRKAGRKIPTPRRYKKA